jgi:hypothetical protein
MEITGNKFAREAFNELGIQKTAGIYDYESPSIQKYKNELASKVKELLEMEDLRNSKTINNSNANQTSVNLNNSANGNGVHSNINNSSTAYVNSSKSSIDNTNQINESNSDLNKEKKEEEKPDVKFTDFKIEAKENSTIQKKPETKISKTSKIKKVDFDFDFDSFNDINFSNFENNNTNGNTSSDKKEDPFASFEEKKKEETNDFSNNNNNNNGGSYLNENERSGKDYLSKNNNIVITDKIRQEADKKFANKKAVGWEDYANL